MSEQIPSTLPYAEGGFERAPRALTALQTIDFVFASLVLFMNGLMFYAFVTWQPSIIGYPGTLEVRHAADWIGFAERCISILLGVGLVAIAWQLGVRRYRMHAIQLHWWYVWIKLLLAAIAAVTAGWGSYSDVHDIDGGDATLAFMLGGIFFVLSALHPVIVLCILRSKALWV
jgi:hypothetical protein